jgi:hypothetical protein
MDPAALQRVGLMFCTDGLIHETGRRVSTPCGECRRLATTSKSDVEHRQLMEMAEAREHMAEERECTMAIEAGIKSDEES